MDVGFTKSNKSHPVHFFTGLIIVMSGFSACMFLLRPLVIG